MSATNDFLAAEGLLLAAVVHLREAVRQVFDDPKDCDQLAEAAKKLSQRFIDVATDEGASPLAMLLAAANLAAGTTRHITDEGFWKPRQLRPSQLASDA